jgi:hypothetical protein
MGSRECGILSTLTRHHSWFPFRFRASKLAIYRGYRVRGSGLIVGPIGILRNTLLFVQQLCENHPNRSGGSISTKKCRKGENLAWPGIGETPLAWRAIGLPDYLHRFGGKHTRGLAMDHQEKHQQHKEKEREHKKKEEKEYEEQEEKYRLPIHPAWVVVIGVALIFMVVYVWTFWWR